MRSIAATSGTVIFPYLTIPSSELKGVDYRIESQNQAMVFY